MISYVHITQQIQSICTSPWFFTGRVESDSSKTVIASAPELHRGIPWYTMVYPVSSCSYSFASISLLSAWLVTILSSLRRRLRRQRALARASWYWHRKGLRPLSFLGLKQLRTTLASHHSVDPSFFRRITAEMERLRQAPWKCRFCKRLNKAVAMYCGQCGRHWTEALDGSYRHPTSARAKEEDYYSQWEEEIPWEQEDWHSGRWPSQSPRAFSRSQTPHGGKKPRKTKKSKKQKDVQEYQAPPLPEAPWNHKGGKGYLGGSSSATTSNPPTQETKSDQKLKQIMAALKKHEANLTPDLQQLAQETTMVQSQDNTRQLHSAVSKLGQAKKVLQKLRASRQNLHVVWKNYIAESVNKWKDFCEQFEKQDNDLARQLQEALQSVKTAEAGLESTKKEAKEIKEDEDMSEQAPQEISDDENPEQLDLNGANIMGGMNDMLKSLEALQQCAEAAIEAKAPKRPRLDDPGGGDGGQSAAVSLQQTAGQPFQQPGQ